MKKAHLISDDIILMHTPFDDDEASAKMGSDASKFHAAPAQYSADYRAATALSLPPRIYSALAGHVDVRTMPDLIAIDFFDLLR